MRDHFWMEMATGGLPPPLKTIGGSRCKFCISDPATRLEKLKKRRAILADRLEDCRDKITIINHEIAELEEES